MTQQWERTNHKSHTSTWTHFTNIMASKKPDPGEHTPYDSIYVKFSKSPQWGGEPGAEGVRERGCRGAPVQLARVWFLHWQLAEEGLSEASLSSAFWSVHFLFGCYTSIKSYLNQLKTGRPYGLANPAPGLLQRNSCMHTPGAACKNARAYLTARNEQPPSRPQKGEQPCVLGRVVQGNTAQ